MIVCRFILGLRQIETPENSLVSGTQSISMRFVGNMGQSLRIGAEDEGHEEEDWDLPGFERNPGQDGIAKIDVPVRATHEMGKDGPDLHRDVIEEVKRASSEPYNPVCLISTSYAFCKRW